MARSHVLDYIQNWRAGDGERGAEMMSLLPAVYSQYNPVFPVECRCKSTEQSYHTIKDSQPSNAINHLQYKNPSIQSYLTARINLLYTALTASYFTRSADNYCIIIIPAPSSATSPSPHPPPNSALQPHMPTQLRSNPLLPPHLTTYHPKRSILPHPRLPQSPVHSQIVRRQPEPQTPPSSTYCIDDHQLTPTSCTDR